MGSIRSRVYFVHKDRVGTKNKVTNAISCFSALLHSMSNKFISFEHLKDDYSSFHDFGIIFSNKSVGQSKDHTDFLLHDYYLFNDIKLCIPYTSLCDFFILELHARG